MKLCIAGSREYEHLDFVAYYLWTMLPFVTTLVNGSLVKWNMLDRETNEVTSFPEGVDRAALLAALRYGLDVECHPAEWKRYGRAASPRRNTQMVYSADAVVCFWDEMSKGTMNIIGTARQQGKLKAVYGHDMGVLW